VEKHGGFFMSAINQAPAFPAVGFLRLSEVLKIIPLKKTAWYQGIREGRYPAPVSISPRARAYRAEDIRGLIERLGQAAGQ
jgi:predicted DNA-binding transcriptional regulator AlpA